MFLTSHINTQNQLQTVLDLFKTRESVVSQDIRTLLGCNIGDAHTLLEELIAQGLIQADTVRSSTRYSKREFEHDANLVRPDWFAKLEDWFTGGKRESATGMARQLGLEIHQMRATLEEMRQDGLLYGKFVGRMCVYSLRQRGTTRQASAEQMHLVHNTPERVQQRVLMAAGTARGIRKSRPRPVS